MPRHDFWSYAENAGMSCEKMAHSLEGFLKQGRTRKKHAHFRKAARIAQSSSAAGSRQRIWIVPGSFGFSAHRYPTANEDSRLAGRTFKRGEMRKVLICFRFAASAFGILGSGSTARDFRRPARRMESGFQQDIYSADNFNADDSSG